MTRPTNRTLLRVILPLGLACLTAAVWWGAVWRDVDRSVLGRVPILDEAYYLQAAAEIAGGRLLPPHAFTMSPLYPYLVALAGSGSALSEHGVVQGGGPLGIRVLQALMWAAVGLLLWRTARRLLPRRRAWLPPALFLLYRPAAVMASSVMLEMSLTLAATALLCLLTTVRERGARPGDAVAMGVLAGLATLLRANAALLILVCLWELRPRGRREDSRKKKTERPGRAAGWAPALILLATAVAVVSPAVIFNSVRSGRLVGPSLNGGINLYIGNFSEANGHFQSFPGFDATTDPAGIDFLSRRLGRETMDEAEADRVWMREGWDHIRSEPWRAMKLWLHKARLHFSAAEIPQITPLESWADRAPWLRVMVVPYGLIAALGLLGAVLAGLRDRRLRPWVLALVLLVASQSVFFVVSRYRLVLTPMLALLGGAGIADLASRRGGRNLGIGLAAAVLAVVAVIPWGQSGTTGQLRAAGLVNEAGRWQSLVLDRRDAGDVAGADAALAESETLLREALAMRPDLTLGYRALSRTLYLDRRMDEAEDVLRRGVGAANKPRILREDLVRLLLGRNDGAAALPVMRDYLAERPDDMDMLHNYAVALAGTGDFAAALAAADRMIAIVPGDPRGHSDKGVVLARAGRLAEAVAAFGRGLESVPGDRSLLANYRRAREQLAAAEAAEGAGENAAGTSPAGR